ncbi:MAG TPA: lipocalin-like domain-containing protein [Myxococcaceae bacterium]|nr:lipocalin-like domain-containing protein [Myxococcaceae bacterium]
MDGPPLSQSLPGTWRLLSREDRTAAGERRVDPGLGADPEALLFYDRAGNFAAQFMKRDRTGGQGASPAASGPNNSRAVGGYDAYFGSYAVDDGAGTVTQRLLGALAPENVGLVVTRSMRITGDELVIQLGTASADGTPVTRTLRWRRVA